LAVLKKAVEALQSQVEEQPEKKGLGGFELVESKDAKQEEVKADSTLRTLLRGLGSKFGLPEFATFRLNHGQQVVVNSVANRYLQFIGGSNTYAWTNLVNSAEFATLDALFDEVFIKAVKIRYFPRNMHSAQSAASTTASGSPGDLNTCAAAVIFMPHNATAFADNSSSWQNMMSVRQSKLVDLGSHWSFEGKNIERFDWRGPMMDQSTSVGAMGWCEFKTVSTAYGGYFQLATPANTGAASGIGTLLEGGIFGDVMITYDIAVRARA